MKYCATGLNRELRSVHTSTQFGTDSKDHFTHAYFSTYADIVALDLRSVIDRIVLPSLVSICVVQVHLKN